MHHILFVRTFITVCFFATLLRCHSRQPEQTVTSAIDKISPDSLAKYIRYDTQAIAFINASIIDGTGSKSHENHALIIQNGLIKAIGPTSEINVPKGFKIIDLSGKTIIPGLIGMHNHLHIPRFPDVGEVAASLYLAAGVTTIQTCGAASPEAELKLAKRIAKGQKLGPDIIPSAPFITGDGGNPNMIIPGNEQHLRDTMKYWLEKGVRWFKVYRNTKPEDLKTAIEVAHKSGGKVRGHLCSITFEEASKMGIDGIEHGLNSVSDFRTNKEDGVCNGGREYMDELIINSSKVQRLQKVMIENNVFLTSTLSIFEASIPNRAYADKRALEAMSPFLIAQYEERRKQFDEALHDSSRNQRLKRIMEFEYQYFKKGGLLCSGVDAGRHVLPGFGDQRNFILHRESGFTTEEAIQIMTKNGAMALDRNDIGTLKAGKRADFVILNGKLDEDPNVIQNVETVFKKGLGYDPAKILNSVTGKFGLE